MGDVDAAVVDSALGYFAPSVVAGYWDSGRAVAAPRHVAGAHIDCCRDFGRRHLDGAPFLATFVPAAAKVLAAASPLALPLFAGVKALSLPGDLPGAATQAVAAIREFGAGVHCFAAARLVTDPSQALVAVVRVGEAPVGLTALRDGTLIVVADSNRFSAPGAHADLTVINVADALDGRPAIVGDIGAGLFPRDMTAAPNGTVLVSNFSSGQVETVDTATIP